MNKETGGAAFPVHPDVNMNSDLRWCGMTLRDYFAAQAMKGFCAGAQSGDNVAIIPSLSYEMADEMLKARAE